MQIKITAVVLAAGQSQRMGRPKMLLPWAGTTVLGQVIATLKAAGLADVLVVIGAERESVEEIARQHGARSVYNAEYSSVEMLSSLQQGLRAASPEADAILVCLGDQPQMQESTVRGVLNCYREGKSTLVAPSHSQRRGHPWLAARLHWQEILSLRPPASPRDFLNAHAAEIHYFSAGTDSILMDLDTPEEYLKSKPAGGK